MRALHTAATGMMAQELNVQVISNNIANMRTTGYKRQRAEFQDLLYEHVRRVGTQTSDQGNHAAGRHRARLGRQDRRHAARDDPRHAGADRQGLDVAIRGEGFFQITLPDGRTAYTRDGSFELDCAGPHRHRARQRAQPGLTIPQNATRSRSTRRARSRRRCRADTTPTMVGQIQLAIFVNKAGLQAHRRQPLSSKRPPPARRRSATPNQDGFGDLQQGYLEQANVEAVSEISDLIAAQRAYEMNAKVITATDQMLQSTSQMLR